MRSAEHKWQCRKKFLADSTSRKHVQSGQMQFLKLFFKSMFVKVTQA